MGHALPVHLLKAAEVCTRDDVWLIFGLIQRSKMQLLCDHLADDIAMDNSAGVWR